MCGRFALHATPEELIAGFDVAPPPAYAPRYNIAPSQPLLSLVAGNSGPEFELFDWGLVPSWCKDPRASHRPINARAETVAEKPSFRSAYRRRRCLVPASGYYEWQKIAGGKQACYIHAGDGACFALAALWEYWEHDGSVIMSSALLTCAANEDVAAVHHRMPVIISPDDYLNWLAPLTPMDVIDPMLQPPPSGRLQVHGVSSRVNSPANDSPECIAPEPLQA